MAGVHGGRAARAGAVEDFVACTVPVFFCRGWDPDCAVQTCSLRDVAAELGDLAIVGMNPDSVERLADALLGDD